MVLIMILVQILLFGGFLFFEKFLGKKGENFAIKQDIREITNSIKSVESKYDSSLELFKMKLLYEHEFSKSLFEICNNLDKELIDHLIKCKKDIERDDSYESLGESGHATKSINDLGDFLHSYESRYSNLKDFNNLIKECDNMKDVIIDLNYHIDINRTKYSSVTTEAHKYIKNILSTIIPPIKVNETKKPEL